MCRLPPSKLHYGCIAAFSLEVNHVEFTSGVLENTVEFEWHEIQLLLISLGKKFIKPQIPHSHIPVMFGEHWCARWCWCSSTWRNLSRNSYLFCGIYPPLSKNDKNAIRISTIRTHTQQKCIYNHTVLSLITCWEWPTRGHPCLKTIKWTSSCSLENVYRHH